MHGTWKATAVAAALGAGAYAGVRLAAAWSRRYDFRDRLVVITGGSRGLGLLMARQLAQQGARLVLISRDHQELDRAADELRMRGAAVATYVGDLTQPPEIEDLFERVRRDHGPVDVLINNAGIIQVGPVETMTLSDYHEAMAIHFWAPLLCIEQVLPEMRRRRQGRIVNISSIGGEMAVPHLLPYCASKFALVGLSEGLRAELAGSGIYVTTVSPGMMRTGSPPHGLFKGQHRAEFAWFSIGGALPGFSMNAERAARQIICACRYGRAKLTPSLPAKLAVRAEALFPELLAEINALVARLLPKPGGVGRTSVEGFHSKSTWSPSLLTALNDRAAERNNELTSRASAE